MAERTKPHYANADKTKIVPEHHPDARYVVNPHDPGEFADLLKEHQKGGHKSEHKAQEPAEDKGFQPLPPDNPEHKKQEHKRK